MLQPSLCFVKKAYCQLAPWITVSVFFVQSGHLEGSLLASGRRIIGDLGIDSTSYYPTDDLTCFIVSNSQLL